MENGGNFEFLNHLKKRQSELERINHPMIRYEDSFRYLYVFGLGVMALGNMKAMMELQNYFDEILDKLCISKKNMEQVIIDINNYFDFRLTECIDKLKEKEVQYCFILDLYKMYQLTLWSQDYCEKILDYYQQIFRFSDIERKFFEGFSDCSSKKDVDRATEMYTAFRKKGYEIRYSILTYFFPENNLIAGGVSTYIEGHWGTAEIMKSASFGGLIFTLVRILPVIPLTIIVLKRTEADRFLADISFLLIVLLCVSFSSITLLLRYSNVTIAILFVVLLLTTTDSQKALNELRISLLSFIIMFGCYAYTQRATLARFELHYRSIISPITLIGDYKYTDEWVQENLDSKGEYYQR